MERPSLIGVIVDKFPVPSQPRAGSFRDRYAIHAGQVLGTDGHLYTFTASECFRNGTTCEALPIGVLATFGPRDDGTVDFISYRVTLND